MGRIVVAVLAIALLGAAGVVAVENQGATEITLDGGSRGVVPFPHHRHQDALKDCKLCHTLFPQEPSSIARLKKEGTLIQKQVMNKLCIKCHKSKQKDGIKSGPTTCSKCHVKAKS